MKRKIFKTGNSLVVSLPKEMLDSLGLSEGSEVAVTVEKEQRHIAIKPAEEPLPGVNETFARQVAEFIEAYRPALDALAHK